MFVEPLGELMRDSSAKLGLPLPRPRTHAHTQHALCSQFADDVQLFTDSLKKMEAALTLITEEFCVASGAKLNTRKTRTLSSHTQGSDITKSLRSRCLKGAE